MCVYMYHEYVWCLKRSKECLPPPRTGGTGGCQLPDMGAMN